MPDSPSEQVPGRVELEAKLTFLERTVEVMSKVMHEQGEQIDRLELRLAKLESKFESEEDDRAGGGLRPHDDPPPHY